MDIPLVLYKIYGYAIPIVLLAVLYGFRWKVGLWGNCLTLGAMLFSLLVAVGWWEDLAELLAKQASSLLFLADCVAFWALFVVTFGILDTLTRFMSTIKVKYHEHVENVGNGAVLFLLFLTLYGTFLFAEEIGPVGEHASVSTPKDSMLVSTTITQIRNLSVTKADGGDYEGNLSAFTQGKTFDKNGDFRQRHLQRRHALMKNVQGGGSGGGGNQEGGTIQYQGNTIPPRR